MSFTLCYRHSCIPNDWKCESGYNSVDDVDRRCLEIRKYHQDMVTTFFPFSRYTPKIYQQKKIQWELMKVMVPKIDIREK